MMQELESQPVNNVIWVEREKLKANDYNPNKVAPVELELLIESILTCGWTQPIVIRSSYEIVDGFHRWSVSDDERLRQLTGGKVPCVMLPDNISQAEQISATITHNRARGSHYVLSMSDIVKSLKNDHGVSDDWLQTKLGMDGEEIDRLFSSTTSPNDKGETEFNKGWVANYNP